MKESMYFGMRKKKGHHTEKLEKKEKNNFGDGIWRGTNKMFKTFYKYHSIDEVKEMFALYGFEFVRRIPAPSNDALLFKKIPYNLFRSILTAERITDAIPRFENIEKPESVKPKRMKATLEKKAIIPDPYPLSIEKLYAEALHAIPTKDMAEEYHRLVSQIVLRIFRNSLRNMVIKVTMDQQLKIIDTVYSNDGGFFTKISKSENINCNYIALEAKNYSDDLENPQYDQIKGRLDPDVGQLGLLVCRKIRDVEKSNKLCQSFIRDHKYIIVLTDKELIDLLELSSDNNTEEIDDFMDAKLRSIKFGSI